MLINTRNLHCVYTFVTGMFAQGYTTSSEVMYNLYQETFFFLNRKKPKYEVKGQDILSLYSRTHLCSISEFNLIFVNDLGFVLKTG